MTAADDKLSRQFCDIFLKMPENDSHEISCLIYYFSKKKTTGKDLINFSRGAAQTNHILIIRVDND